MVIIPLQGYANMSTVAGIKSLDVYILSSPSIHPSSLHSRGVTVKDL